MKAEQLISFLEEKSGALISEGLMATGRFRYQIGQTYQLASMAGVSIKFVGTFRSRDPAYNSVILAGGDYIEELDGAIGESSQLYSLVDRVENAPGVARAIDGLALPFKTETRQQKAYLATVRQELADLIAFQRLIMLVALTVILVGVGNTISMATRDRVREIGTFRALGFQRHHIVGIVLAEATCVALLGAALGAVAATGYLTSARLEDAYMGITVPVSVSPRILAAAVGVPTLLGLLGGLLPAIACARQPITASIRGAE